MIMNAPTLQNIHLKASFDNDKKHSNKSEEIEDPIKFSSVCHRSNYGDNFQLRDCLL